MQMGNARNLGEALVEAGILTDARPEGHRCKALSQTHGPQAISGHWASTGRRCLIACDDVAMALLEAGGWTVEAIRACKHSLDAPLRKRRTLRVVKPQGCPCPAHRGEHCPSSTTAAVAAA